MGHDLSKLFKKYNVAGPRYTSYPTVPYWETTPTEAEWLASINEALKQAAATKSGAAMYVHVPFCETLCTYCGCNTRITKNHGVGMPYVDVVLKEWEIYRQKLGTGNTVPLSDLHLGGGTPTFLSVSELVRMVEGILKHTTPAAHSEFSVEADPRVTTMDQMQALAKLGFRRLSLGIQDFDIKVQTAVNRVQPYDCVAKVTEDARTAGYGSVNFDLIYGLPFQTLASIEDTFNLVLKLMPERIAFYSYAHVPWIKPSQRRFTEADLPDGETKRALYELGRTKLEAAGYREIGMDHFALESDSLWKAAQSGELFRNFMGYTARHVSPQFGLGVSAIGDSWTAFMQNEKVLEKYQSRVQAGELPILRGHVLTGEDQILRRHILNLMTKFATAWRADVGSVAFLGGVPEGMREFVSDGLVQLSGDRVLVTGLGRAFLRNICMVFDARLKRQATSGPLFSKTL